MVKTNRFIYGIMTSPTVHVYLFIAVTMFVVGNKALGVFLLEKNEKKNQQGYPYYKLTSETDSPHSKLTHLN